MNLTFIENEEEKKKAEERSKFKKTYKYQPSEQEMLQPNARSKRITEELKGMSSEELRAGGQRYAMIFCTQTYFCTSLSSFCSNAGIVSF